MHLKQLKLAGFKSFVDPTVVPFSSQLVAVVGPNGCGKSNIIDAVRWVMGESLAKNMRGDSMADVIFKGSSNRKPVGQASVELLFDNSMGRVVGPYASYQEIAVKRVVTRDGESTYYLNGSRCRRRDITDIFLGTGAGARGYSIIGQDTISRLIEARPEDLRSYLEEAAGVSKYKERRRETLVRITHTRENLARVSDIRDELDKQLVRLERQAKAASRYTALKQEERACRVDILALKWGAINAEYHVRCDESSQLSKAYEHHERQLACAQSASEVLRARAQEAQSIDQHMQTQFYQLATEMARLDETIQQHRRDRERWALEKQQLDRDWQMAHTQLLTDQDAMGQSEQNLAQVQHHYQSLQHELDIQKQQLADDQQQALQWTTQSQQNLIALNQAARDADVEQVRLQHLVERDQDLQLSIEKMHSEYQVIDVDGFQRRMDALIEEKNSRDTHHEGVARHHQRIMEQGVILRAQISDLEPQLHHLHDKIQAKAIEHATVQAVQNAALRETLTNTLPRFDESARLAEVMQVDDAWLRVFEVFFADSLQAVVVDSLEAIGHELHELQGHSIAFTEPMDVLGNTAHYPRLIDKITGIKPQWPVVLADILAADTLDEARAWWPTLHPSQSIITLDGYWLGSGWVRVLNLNVPEDDVGLLSRKQVLLTLRETLTEWEAEQHILTENRDHFYALLGVHEREQDTAKEALSVSLDAMRASDVLIQQAEQALAYAVMKQRTLADDMDARRCEREACAALRLSAEDAWHAALARKAVHEQESAVLLLEATRWKERAHASEQAFDAARTVLHQTELQCNQEAAHVEQLRLNIQREQRAVDTLSAKSKALAERCIEPVASEDEPRAMLEQKVAQHTALEAQLALGRETIADLQAQCSALDRTCKQESALVAVTREQRQHIEMQAQALAVRASALVEQLQALDADAAVILDAIPTGTTLDTREQTLLDLGDKIKRLGAINLLAIEEYETDLQRKTYLDTQYTDLVDALLILDDAIATLDKDTQQRLKETFLQVNGFFQSLFPRLFGGGHATLELTCGNLLEAGVLVMAQPPGKRNSSIQMLSGGEKAMTAVALVFAIFQLNPSPFCMLDEVDAPLDEANVRRFCDLVKDMSQFVQFLVVTHNKVTMELADHLIGVTMREPGVSRIVAVDVALVLDNYQANDVDSISRVE